MVGGCRITLELIYATHALILRDRFSPTGCSTHYTLLPTLETKPLNGHLQWPIPRLFCERSQQSGMDHWRQLGSSPLGSGDVGGNG